MGVILKAQIQTQGIWSKIRDPAFLPKKSSCHWHLNTTDAVILSRQVIDHSGVSEECILRAYYWELKTYLLKKLNIRKIH